MEIDGLWYNCAEKYMMAEKARLFKDDETLSKIMAAIDPSDQKRYGREVQGFDKDKWDAVARDVVYKGSMAKYTQNPNLKRYLLATVGTTLVEASPKDNIWGIGLAKDDPRAQDRSTWRGKNWLGETLTKVRDNIILSIKDQPFAGLPEKDQPFAGLPEKDQPRTVNSEIRTKDSLILSIDFIIKYLTEVRGKITDNNVHNFDISQNQSRDIRPMHEMGKIDATYQKQMGPDVLTFCLRDWTSNGKEFR
jgi:hypothetical protein